MERRLRVNIAPLNRALLCLAQRLLGVVPSGLLKLDAQLFKLVAQQLVHHAIGIAHFGVNVVAQLAQIDVFAQLLRRMAIGVQLAVFGTQKF